MPHVLLERPLHPAGRAVLDARPGVTVEVATDVSDFATRATKADAILLWLSRVDAAFLNRCPTLKVVARYGVGFDTIDIPECTRRGLPVAVVNGANDLGVAEHAMGLLLGVARQVPAYDKMVKGGRVALGGWPADRRARRSYGAGDRLWADRHARRPALRRVRHARDGARPGLPHPAHRR